MAFEARPVAVDVVRVRPDDGRRRRGRLPQGQTAPGRLDLGPDEALPDARPSAAGVILRAQGHRQDRTGPGTVWRLYGACQGRRGRFRWSGADPAENFSEVRAETRAIRTERDARWRSGRRALPPACWTRRRTIRSSGGCMGWRGIQPRRLWLRGRECGTQSTNELDISKHNVDFGSGVGATYRIARTTTYRMNAACETL